MKSKPSAHYDDAAGNSFVFFNIGGKFHCYRSLGGGRLIRTPEWGTFPLQTRLTLMNIVGWLRMDLPTAQPSNPSFRYGTLDSCSECVGMFA